MLPVMEQALPLLRLPAGRFQPLPHGRRPPHMVGGIVRRASNSTVPSPACRPRLLLIAQQVAVLAGDQARQGNQRLDRSMGRKSNVSRRCAAAAFGSHLCTTQSRSTLSDVRDSRHKYPRTRRGYFAPVGLRPTSTRGLAPLLQGCITPQLGTSDTTCRTRAGDFTGRVG